MQSQSLTIYLAGSIRDDKPEDLEWRAMFINVLTSVERKVVFLNPCGGKTFNKKTKEWLASGVVPDGRFIVKHDFWAVDHSDIIVFNFMALADRYPNLGTLIEFGRATSTGALMYSIVPPAYQGHENNLLYKLHPFIQENSAAIFRDLDSCLEFLVCHLGVLTGADPHFTGVLS